jgi:hypothetical protein
MLNYYWWYLRDTVLCHSLKSMPYHFSLANYLVHMMLLGAHFKLNLKVSACENLIKTDLMTRKLLKDTEVFQPQWLKSEMNVNSLPHFLLLGTRLRLGKGTLSRLSHA